MKKIIVLFIVLLGHFTNGEVAVAITINVPADYTSIQDALNAANPGDIVLVQPGTYYENIIWPSVQGIKLISAGDTTNTTIDGSDSARVIVFPDSNFYDTTTVVSGFRITNGHFTASFATGGAISLINASPLLTNLNISGNRLTGGGWAYGGGIYCRYSNPVLRNLMISNNECIADRAYAGGLYCDGSSPVLNNVTISNNQLTGSMASSGGGIYCGYNSSPTLTDVYIISNMLGGAGSWFHGGGIHCNNKSSPVLVNVLIALNQMGSGGTWYYGGAIYCWDSCAISLTNVTMANNTAPPGEGVGGTGIYCDNSSATLINTISWNAQLGGELLYYGTGYFLVDYSNIRQGYVGIGNLNLNPKFVSATNAHLSSVSPCIDGGTLAGAPSTDIEGLPRPSVMGANPDMGAYEFQNCFATSAATISVSSCESYTVPSGDETYITDGTYNDTIANVAGCDSVLTINVTILKAASGLITDTSCNYYTVPSGDEIYNVSGVYTDTIPNSIGCDSIITINLTILSTSSSITVVACNSYLAPSGNYLYSWSGWYVDQMTNVAGCDSNIYIDLTINTVDTSVINSSPTLTANASGAVYQWMYCDSTIIPDSIKQSYTANSSGSYAVIVAENNCVDTSGCYEITIVILEVPEFNKNVAMFPNPSSGLFTLDLRNNTTDVHLQVYNTLGQLVKVITLKPQTKHMLDLSMQANGLYYINLLSGRKVYTGTVSIIK